MIYAWAQYAYRRFIHDDGGTHEEPQRHPGAPSRLERGPHVRRRWWQILTQRQSSADVDEAAEGLQPGQVELQKLTHWPNPLIPPVGAPIEQPTSSTAIAVAAFGLSILALSVAVGVLFVQLMGCK